MPVDDPVGLPGSFEDVRVTPGDGTVCDWPLLLEELADGIEVVAEVCEVREDDPIEELVRPELIYELEGTRVFEATTLLEELG